MTRSERSARRWHKSADDTEETHQAAGAEDN